MRFRHSRPCGKFDCSSIHSFSKRMFSRARFTKVLTHSYPSTANAFAFADKSGSGDTSVDLLLRLARILPRGLETSALGEQTERPKKTWKPRRNFQSTIVSHTKMAMDLQISDAFQRILARGAEPEEVQAALEQLHLGQTMTGLCRDLCDSPEHSQVREQQLALAKSRSNRYENSTTDSESSPGNFTTFLNSETLEKAWNRLIEVTGTTGGPGRYLCGSTLTGISIRDDGTRLATFGGLIPILGESDNEIFEVAWVAYDKETGSSARSDDRLYHGTIKQYLRFSFGDDGGVIEMRALDTEGSMTFASISSISDDGTLRFGGIARSAMLFPGNVDPLRFEERMNMPALSTKLTAADGRIFTTELSRRFPQDFRLLAVPEQSPVNFSSVDYGNQVLAFLRTALGHGIDSVRIRNGLNGTTSRYTNGNTYRGGRTSRIYETSDFVEFSTYNVALLVNTDASVNRKEDLRIYIQEIVMCTLNKDGDCTSCRFRSVDSRGTLIDADVVEIEYPSGIDFLLLEGYRVDQTSAEGETGDTTFALSLDGHLELFEPQPLVESNAPPVLISGTLATADIRAAFGPFDTTLARGQHLNLRPVSALRDISVNMKLSEPARAAGARGAGARGASAAAAVRLSAEQRRAGKVRTRNNRAVVRQPLSSRETEDKIKSAYFGVLGRGADMSGLSHYMTEVDSKKMDIRDVRTALTLSAEARSAPELTIGC